MSKKGYDFDEIQGAMEKGLTAKTGPRLRQNLIESGLRSLRNVVPETPPDDVLSKVPVDSSSSDGL